MKSSTILNALGALLVSPGLCPGGVSEFSTAAPEPGIECQIIQLGQGDMPKPGDYLVYHWIGKLPDGSIFWNTREEGNVGFVKVGGVASWGIPGVPKAIASLHAGTRANLTIPPQLAFGRNGIRGWGFRVPVPPNSLVVAEVEVLSVKHHSLAAVLKSRIDAEGLEGARRFMAGFSGKATLDVFFENPKELVDLAKYYLVRANEPGIALALLEWNAELNEGRPHWDLALGYVMAGDRARARREHANLMAKQKRQSKADYGVTAGEFDLLTADLSQPLDNSYLMRLWVTGAGQDWAKYIQELEGKSVTIPAFDTLFYQGILDQCLSTAAALNTSKQKTMADCLGDFFAIVERQTGSFEQVCRHYAESPIPLVQAVANDWLKNGNPQKRTVDIKFTAIDGRVVNTVALQGKVVLVDFWGTSCGPCVDEIPNVVSAYQKYHNKGFEVIGISFETAPNAAKPDKSQRSVEQLRTFVAENQMPWPQYYDGKGWNNTIGKQFDVEMLPAMFLVGRDGRIASKSVRGEKLEPAIRTALGL